MLSYHKTTEHEKYQICQWKYQGNYAVYNLPPYDKMKREKRGMAFTQITDAGEGEFYRMYWKGKNL